MKTELPQVTGIEQDGQDFIISLAGGNDLHAWRQSAQHKDLKKATQFLADHYFIDDEQRLKPGLWYGFDGDNVTWPLLDMDGTLREMGFLNLEEQRHRLPHAPAHIYTPDYAKLKRAKQIYLVRYPADALVLTLAGCTALAYLHPDQAETLPLNWLRPTQVVYLWPDPDANDHKRVQTLYHRLISHGNLPIMVYQNEDKPALPHSLIRDFRGNYSKLKEAAENPNTSPFPAGSAWFHDGKAWGRLQQYRLGRDNVVRQTDDGQVLVAEWRPYRLDQIELLPDRTALFGMVAGRPLRKLLVHYARPDAADQLLTETIDARQIGQDSTWNNLGITLEAKDIKKLIAGLSRDTRHARKTVNVVGLVKMDDDQLQLNDASNTYQNPGDYVYHDLIFPDTPQSQAATIIRELDQAFTQQQATVILAWMVGSFLKAYAKAWPHCMLEAGHDSGKTRLFGWLTHLTGFLSMPHTEPTTGYRRIQMLRGHMFPVGIDEISRLAANYPKDFESLVHLLNESYVGNTQTYSKVPYFVSAPVIMTGQDDPFQHDAAIDAKMIKLSLDRSKGVEYLPQKGQHFPMRAWADWIASTLSEAQFNQRLKHWHKKLMSQVGDELAQDKTRFVTNYALLLVAGELMLNFAGLQHEIDLSKRIIYLFKQHLTLGKPMRKESFGILRDVATLLYSERPNTYPLIKVKQDGEKLTTNPDTQQTERHRQYVIHTSANILLGYLKANGKGHAVTSPKKLLDHLEADGFLVRRPNGQRTGTIYVRGIQINSGIWLDWNKIQAADIDWPLDAKAATVEENDDREDIF